MMELLLISEKSHQALLGFPNLPSYGIEGIEICGPQEIFVVAHVISYFLS